MRRCSWTGTRLLLLAITLVGWTARAASGPPPGAAVLPGAGSLVVPGHGGSVTHAWMIVRSLDGVALIHIPPRTQGGTENGGVLAASGGSVRQVMVLEQMPVSMCAVDQRLYLVFEDTDAGGRVARRSVKSLEVLRSGLGALWKFEPMNDTVTEPSLPPGGKLLGLAQCGMTLAALISEAAEANPAAPRIHILHRDRWLAASLPPEIADQIAHAAGPVRVVSMREGVGVAIPASATQIDVWLGRVELPKNIRPRYFADDSDESVVPAPAARPASRAKPSAPAEPANPAPAWTWKPQRFEIDAANVGILGAGVLVECGGGLVWIEPAAGGEVRISELAGGSATLIAQLSGVTLPITAASLDGDGRLAVVWSELEEPGKSDLSLKPSAPTRRFQVREISAHTGRVLYQGLAKSTGPVSPNDFRLLSIALLVTMALVLLLVLRPDPNDGVIAIPEGYALAESGRRLVAGIADVVMALWVSCVLWGVDFAQVLSPEGMIGGVSWIVAGTALGVGILTGTVGEWRTGRSPGKLLTGCEVISISGPLGQPGHEILRRPGFWRSLERNILKWLLPPMAMLGLLDHQGRHRADMMARTIVVIPWADEEEGPGEP